jgi:ribose transport system permease protein
MNNPSSIAPVANSGSEGPSATRRRGLPVAAVFTRFGVIWALIIVVVAAEIIYSRFLGTNNLRVVLTQTVPIGLVAVGMTVLMLSGAFDLSAGPTFALGAVVYAKLSNDMALSEAALVALLVGAGVGLVNGLITTKLRINSFITTLGTASIVTGAAFIYTDASPVTSSKTSFATLGASDWIGVPICVWLLIGFLVVSGLGLYYTKFGRSVYAIGGNLEASRLCGIRVDLLRVLCYVIASCCAVAGGIVLASQLTIVEPSVGANYSLEAIAIVIVGGTSLMGGEGAMWRTAVGMLILGAIANVLDAKAVDANWQSIVTGIVLIVAVCLDVLGRRFEGFHLRRATGLAEPEQ